jgi:ribonuclease BN (tRNA processing enzyme)
LKVTILGSGGSAVSEKRACPSILVDDSTIFDLGPGSLKNLRAAHLDMEKPARVFISHTHADHISDLVPFLWAIQIDGRQKPLALYGPPGFKKTLSRLLQCTSTSDDFFKFPLTVSDLDFGEAQDNVRTCRTSHTIPTMAFRIEANGKSFCYTADTIYCPAVIELARNTDLLIHEATFLEDQLSIAELTRHSTPRMAGKAAKEASAKRLALFHIPPPNDRREKEFYSDAKLEFGDEVTVGEDMVMFDL